MTILLSGGGTGGHITPILAVASELKRLRPEVHIVYVAEKGSKFSELTKAHAAIDEVRTVRAGKFRRYHGESWLVRLLDLKTLFLNLRDALLACLGLLQAWWLLGRLKPQVVFLKGGFVGVPVGYAARWRHIPYVTHDSDIVPGLANRLVKSNAALHATALPKEYYPQYESSKVRHVGVLVESSYQFVTPVLQADYKKKLNVAGEGRVVLVTGGSSGAQRINEAVVKIIDKLLQSYPDIFVIHQTGKGKGGVYGSYTHERLRVLEFMQPMHVYSGAADLVVARASANTLAELGIQAKAVIVIAGRFLADGHQLKNAQYLNEHAAAISLDEVQLENDSELLLTAIYDLLDHDDKRARLAGNLQKLTVPGAASAVAQLLLEQADKK